VSVAVTAPSVFQFTAPADPDRHLEAAKVFGKDVSTAKREDAGEILSDAIREFLIGLGDQPRGIKAIGYERSDIPSLVEGTLPQRRVLDLAPDRVAREDLEQLFEKALTY
jgi:hydroxyacid-oxoacid transhydrogenase